MNSNKFCKGCDRQALTLVEVITSIVLLSTLIVGMLTAYARHVRQINRASEIKQAVQLSDHLLGTWFASSDPLPVSRSGYLDVDAGLLWRLDEKPGGDSRSYGARVLQLSVLNANAPSNQPIIQLEILDSDDNAKTETSQ